MNRETIIEAMARAMSVADESRCLTYAEIATAALAAIEAAGVRLVPATLSEQVIAELVPRPPHWPPEGEAPRMDAAVMTDRTVVIHMYRRLLAASPYAKETNNG